MLRAGRLVALWQRQARAPSTHARLSLTRALSSDAQPSAPSSSAARDGEAAALSAALEGCRDSGDWRKALKLLDALDQRGSVDARMYEHAVAACARVGKVDVLPGLLHNMQADGLRPTAASVDFVVQAHLAREEWRALCDYVARTAEMKVPLSSAAFQAAMEACGQERDARTAMAIVDSMGPAALDAGHYAAAIRAVGMGGRADLAVQLFSAMEDEASGRAIQADADVFTQLIRAQIVNRSLSQALRTITTADKRGVAGELPESIFTATVDALVKNGDYWQAARLFEHMLALELRPSAFCLGRAMVAYVRSNKNPMAWAVWEKLQVAADATTSEAPGTSMNTLFKFVKLLNELASTKNAKIAVSVFEWIYARYDMRDIRTATVAVAIRSYGRDGQTEKAMALFDAFTESRKNSSRPMPRDAAVYVAAFNALSRDEARDPHENTHDAKRVWNLMVKNVPVVLPPAYASLAGVFASSGELDTLEQVLMQAGASVAVDGEDASAEYSDDEDDEEVLASIDISDLSDVDDDEQRAANNDELLFNGVISGFAKARRDQSNHILTYLKLMRSRGLTINDSIVRAATDAFVRHERWPLVNQLAGFLDISRLQNPDVCFGDTISKLLDAKADGPARHWLTLAHSNGLNPPIRNKMTVLRRLREAAETSSRSDAEWKIAYALARETLSFKQLSAAHVDSVADAIDVCIAAGRADLASKLYYQLSHAVNHSSTETLVPLRVYKQVVLTLLRERDARDADQYEKRVGEAESICADMLRVHGKNLDGDALSVAISLKATIGDDDDVRAIFESMQAMSLEPNSYAENAAITAYSRAGQTDRVLDVWRGYADDAVRRASIDKNVLRTLLKSLALAKEDEALVRTANEFPSCSMNRDVVPMLMAANRPERAVELVDAAKLDDEHFRELLMRLLSSGNRKTPSDPLVAAALLLKRIRAVGMESVPANDVLRVTKRLLSNEQLVEAERLLSIYTAKAADGTTPLRRLKPYHQKEVMESLLFVHGEQGRFDELHALLDSNPLAFPLTVQHYETAMEFGVDATGSDNKGPLASLRMFKTLREQFVKPSGQVYVLVLRACRRVGFLETAGAELVDDCVDQGFAGLLAHAMTTRGDLAVRERAASTEEEEVETEVDVQELAEIAMICRKRRVRLPAKLVTALGKLSSEMSPNTRNEVMHLVDVQEKKQKSRREWTQRAEFGSETANDSALFLHSIDEFEQIQ